MNRLALAGAFVALLVVLANLVGVLWGLAVTCLVLSSLVTAAESGQLARLLEALRRRLGRREERPPLPPGGTDR